MRNPFKVDRTTKPLKKAAPVYHDPFVKKDESLSEESLAGLAVQAQLGAQHNDELEQFAKAREAQAAAAKRHDDLVWAEYERRRAHGQLANRTIVK